MADLFDDLYHLRKRWVDLLGIEPWRSRGQCQPHREGWCINGYGQHNDMTSLRRSFIKTGGGVLWIDMYFNGQYLAAEFREPSRRSIIGHSTHSGARRFVEQRWRATGSDVYRLPLEIDDINTLLTQAGTIS